MPQNANYKQGTANTINTGAQSNPNNLAAFISNYPNFMAAAAHLNNQPAPSESLESSSSSPNSSVSSGQGNIENLSTIHRSQLTFANNDSNLATANNNINLG